MVSVIITTKNEAGHIQACLESLTHQTYRDIEILVVDNNSSDRTNEIAKRFTKHVYTMGPERSVQRNFGAGHAKGTYLLFLDADMILTPDVVRQCVQKAESRKSLGVVIPEKSFGIGFWAACKTLERASYEGVDWIESARFFQKRTFLELGGYNAALTGPEDFELPQRLKVRFGQDSVGRIDAYILHDEGNLSLAKLLAKKYYYGRQMRRYKKLPESGNYFRMQANPIVRYGLFFKKPLKLLRDPVNAAGLFVMKTLEMGALGLGSVSG